MENRDVHLIIPHLWLGNKYIANNETFLRNRKIELVVNCSNDIPCYFKNNIPNIRYIRIPVDDSLKKKDFKIMTDYLFATVPIIESYIKNKKNVLIHCYAGMQRSACMVAAYMIFRYKKPLFQVVRNIQSIRNVAFTPQINFIDSLLIFQKKYRTPLRVKKYIS